MSQNSGKFVITFADGSLAPVEIEKESIRIGRLESCELVLDHRAVSRIHAGISIADSDLTLANLSASNVLTLNGRSLGPAKSDVLADGDTIQIGPFAIEIRKDPDGSIALTVQRAVSDVVADTGMKAAAAAQADSAPADVLDVFWEKRTREKEDWGTRLRPTEKPTPGKAMFNWRPTRDLQRPWAVGVFVWAFLIVGAIAVFSFFRYPNVYAPKPLANPHAAMIEGSTIAITANGNSCTTCHTPNEPLENACIRCHQAEQFHASNTKAHENAGITCVTCHAEHQGADFQLTATAIQGCAQCHSDNNSKTYNGKGVHTAHGGSYGYPIVDGVWKWKGVYREVADAIPEINSSATGDKDEQARLSRYFHTIHVARLKAPDGVKGDARGLVSCSSCHNTFDPIDRTTPRQTCAACHQTSADAAGRDTRFGSGAANCISCHVQHPYSGRRWNEFLTEEALKRRGDAVTNRIRQFNNQ